MRVVNKLDNNIVLKKHSDQHYYTLFNKRTGLFVRCESEGYEEPFWAESGPELLDISITNWCDKQCKFCYRDSNEAGTFMDLDQFESVLKQASELGVFQIALGGGNPNQHPYFTTMLKMSIEKYGIVPSYTTNGRGMTEEILIASQKYCGAVAISAYQPYYEFGKLVNQLVQNNIKTNIHFLLTNESVDTAMTWLNEMPDFLHSINALIFLNYKPVGKHANNSMIVNTNDRFVDLLNLIDKNEYPFKIGFDSCSISGVVKYINTDATFLEACEAGRFSAFISEDMKMYPCSFMVNQMDGIDLRKYSMIDIWRDALPFIKIRESMEGNRCKNKCNYESVCKGGCPTFSGISLCLDDLNNVT